MAKNFFKDDFRKVVDVTAPPQNRIQEEKFAKKIPRSGKNQKLSPLHISKSLRRTLIASFVILALAGGFIFYSLFNFQNKVINSLETDVSSFGESATNFNPFSSSTVGTGIFGGQNIDFQAPLNLFGTKILPLLKDSVRAYQAFQGVAGKALSLFQKSASLAQDAPKLVFNQKGSELISRLEEVNSLLKDVGRESSDFTSSTSQFETLRESDSDFYVPLQLTINRFHNFLSALLVWLKSESNHHILVLLQNPSEMRPAGGFVGSFADINFQKGNILSINVHDINDPDKTLDLKIVPPKPVQVIASRFRAADANFFFDFPASAGKVSGLIEASNLYKNTSTTFDGVIALSPRVISDLLKVSGPIQIPEEKTTINSDNFLTEIQKQVQSNRAAGDSYPKRILQKITPLLFEKLANLDDAQTQNFFEMASNWMGKKDFMLFFKNPEFQNFFDYYGATGRIYSAPQNFYGDYLAVVNANLGGGKTDIFVSQNILLESQLNDDGTVTENLTIERRHGGDKAKDWWYKVANQDYLQVFTPLGARLQNQSGGFNKVITPKINYQKEGYLVDPLVSQIESTEKSLFNFSNVKTHEEFGKNVFSTWSKIQPGASEKISFSYINRLPFPPLPGRVYEFVFERQAGSSGSYNFEISAPIGFIWKEINLPIFEYHSSDPPGRLVFSLTLAKTQ